MSDKKRAVITGMGVVSPFGVGKEVFWEGLKKGKNTVEKISSFDVSTYPTQIAAQVKDFDPGNFMDKKEARRLVRFIQFAIAAAKMAKEDAKLEITEATSPEIGVMVGSGIGGIGFLEEQTKTLLEKGVSKLSPFTVPYMITNMAAGYVSIVLNAKGPNSCVVTACATGTHCVGEALRLIQLGHAKGVFAGGAEAAITPLGLASFCAARALSSRNDDPSHASRPFEKNRDGFVMGEGAGILYIEELETAKKRGAHIYAELVGYGMSGDAYHITAPAPGGEGAARAISAALKDAGVSPEKIDYINAHGTSTELNDKFETMAIKTVFKDRAQKIPTSSIKSMVGHLLGAAGAIEAIATALTIQEGIIPPTINYLEKDPDCDLDYVPNTAREAKVNFAISNSFGFGGHNAVIALKKYSA